MSIRDLKTRILGPYRISHHPLCDNFGEHTYLIRGRKVCRGCTMQYSGMVLAFLLVILGSLPIINYWAAWNEFQIGILLYFLIFPTILTAFVIKNRKLKDIARLLLGMAFSVAFLLFIFTPNLFVKGFIIINFLPGYFYLQKRREHKNNEICEECNEYEHFPHCSGYQIYDDREKIFLSQVQQGGIKDPFALSPNDLDE
ncbi:MAG: hypothetical protein ACW98I_17945 [Candidatus Hodarchaeales archaeon]|jgi:uncharacterized membrane protein